MKECLDYLKEHLKNQKANHESGDEISKTDKQILKMEKDLYMAGQKQVDLEQTLLKVDTAVIY